LEVLDDIKYIKSQDKSDMLSLLTDFSNQCRDAVGMASSVNMPDNYRKVPFSNILFSGMGGSAFGAHLLLDYLKDELNIPAIVNRDYGVCGFVDKNTLAFFCSYSGNTEETISAYDEAKAKGASIIVITSGGKLIEKAKKDSFLYIKIPSGQPPRTALGYSFFSLLISFQKLGLIKPRKDEINKVISLLDDMSKRQLQVQILSDSNIAKQIACECKMRLPVIYGASSCLDAVVLRWKTQLAENSKVFSSINVFPEMNHNEIVGWQFPDNMLLNSIVVVLRDKCEHPRVSKRIDITNKILKDNDIKILEVNSQGNLLLSRLFSLIYIGDFVSFYLAILNKVDPTSIERIDYLKQKLSDI